MFIVRWFRWIWEIENLFNSNIIVCLVLQFADYCWSSVCLAVAFPLMNSFIFCIGSFSWILSSENWRKPQFTNNNNNSSMNYLKWSNKKNRICWIKWKDEERMRQDEITAAADREGRIWTCYSILFPMNWKYVLRLNDFHTFVVHLLFAAVL